MLVAAPSKARVFGRSLAGIAGSNPTGDMDICLLGSITCCQVEVSVTSQTLVQRSPTESDVSGCDLETLTVRRPYPTRGCRAMKKIRLCDVLFTVINM